MKKVESLITKEEYKQKIEEPIRDEVLKAINKSAEKVKQKLKFISRSWYTPTAISLIVIFAILTTVILFGVGVFASFDIVTKLISLGITAIPFLIGILMLVSKRMKIKQIDAIYLKAMDIEKIYTIAINNIPNFKLEEINNVVTNELNIIRYNAPEEAKIIKISPAFKVKFKEKYQVAFQAARYHWTTTYEDSKGNTKTYNHYAESGYALIETDPKQSEFEFSINGSIFSRPNLNKMDLENKNFLRTTKLKSNDKIKSRMMFTPLAMEEVLKHYPKTSNKFFAQKIGDQVAFSFVALKNQFIIDAVKGSNDLTTANKYIDDIVEDFYTLYEKLGIVLIPPFL